MRPDKTYEALAEPHGGAQRRRAHALHDRRRPARVRGADRRLHRPPRPARDALALHEPLETMLALPRIFAIALNTYREAVARAPSPRRLRAQPRDLRLLAGHRGALARQRGARRRRPRRAVVLALRRPRRDHPRLDVALPGARVQDDLPDPLAAHPPLGVPRRQVPGRGARRSSSSSPSKAPRCSRCSPSRPDRRSGRSPALGVGSIGALGDRVVARADAGARLRRHSLGGRSSPAWRGSWR